MAVLKLLNLFALASVAIVTLSSAPTPVHALVADRAQVARHVHGHHAAARRKRSDTSSPSSSGLCQPRTPSSAPSYIPASAPSTAPSPTSSAPAPSATYSAPPSATIGNGNKWCLAWPNGDAYPLQQWAFSQINMLYTWSADKPSDIPQGMDFAAMLWGLSSDHIADFQQVVEGYANIVLGYNEPNEETQSNVDAYTGYQAWMQYIQPLKAKGYTLVSPACTDDAKGAQWYSEFFGYCDNDPECSVDCTAFHAYTTNAEDLINYATQLHNNYTSCVMVTEFADQNFSGGPQADWSDIWNFAGTVTNFVEETDWIAAACPFGAMQDLQGVNTLNSLMNADGSPNSLAQYYFTGGAS